MEWRGRSEPTGHGVEAVAITGDEAVGYESPSQFRREYRRHFGAAPRPTQRDCAGRPAAGGRAA
jgi:transcriptional regulator GlxA family with amidase domain